MGKGYLKREQFTNGKGENELKGGMVQVSNKYRLTDKSKWCEGKEKWGQGKGYMEDLYTVLTGFLYV